jgi:hypothetical protein
MEEHVVCVIARIAPRFVGDVVTVGVDVGFADVAGEYDAVGLGISVRQFVAVGATVGGIGGEPTIHRDAVAQGEMDGARIGFVAPVRTRVGLVYA